jgi:two-component system sensor histidine kinase GlrK
MKLTIFSRLAAGFFGIILMAMTVSIYAIVQLRQLENIMHSILVIDNQIIDQEKKLSDLLLTMMRYEKKAVIMKDDGLYNNFLLAKNDFKQELTNINSLANSSQTLNALHNIEQQYHHYESLFEKEVNYLKAGWNYDIEKFKQEKESAVNLIMDGLKELKTFSQQNTYVKVKKFGEAKVNASRAAMIIGAISLIFGIIISTFITLNITKPLSIIKRKTREVAIGNFGDKLEVSSPPEIHELANAFNTMCSKLKEIDKLKSDFFSTMSHELRTPLTTIKEGSSLLFEKSGSGAESSQERKLLTIINEECSRLINLVNSLLDLSKIEAGMMIYNFTQANLSHLIFNVIRELEPLIQTKNIKLKTNINESLPPAKIDTGRIQDVMRNLIGNAIKFTPTDGIVTLSAETEDGMIKVAVTDTGDGIAKENLTAIFNKYYQTGYNNKGTGLGLFIVKNIIDAHGGNVWVENTSEQGTTFAFVLPL